MHSKRSPVSVVVVLMEVINQSIVPSCCIPQWITPIQHRSASCAIFVHDVDVRNLPDPWIGQLWTWFFLGRAGLGRQVVQGVGVHCVKTIKVRINRPGEVISEVTSVQHLKHVLSEHKVWCSKSSNFFIGYVCKSIKQSYKKNPIRVEL